MKRYVEPEKKINYQSKINRMVLALGAKGFSVDCIVREVNLIRQAGQDKMTKWQVQYRLHKSGMLLRDYRKGNSKFAESEIIKCRVKVYSFKKDKKKTA